MFACLSNLAYRCLYFPLQMIAVLAWSYRSQGGHNVPARGPVLLIGNHQSFLDIPFMGLACPRRTFFLAKKPLFSNCILRRVMEFFGTVAVDNTGFSRSGLEGILQELKKGQVVMIYPEGERTWDDEVAPLKPGVSLLVKRARCPIVPVGIAGAFGAWPRTRRWMVFAPPFLPWRQARVAVSIGKPLDGAALAECGREEMLRELEEALRSAVAKAKRLRGTAKPLAE